MQKLIEKIKDLHAKGLFHIIISSTLVKVIGFVSAMLLPRVITSKQLYGLLVYVDNIRGYILLLNGLGLSYIAVRFCSSENRAKNKAYFVKAMKIGLIFDFILVAFSFLFYTLLANEYENANTYLYMMAILPIFVFIFESQQLYFRALFENKKFSNISLIFTLFMVIFQVGLGYFFSLTGVVIGRYISYILVIIVSSYWLYKLGFHKWEVAPLTKKETRSMLSFSIVVMFTNALGMLLSFNEAFLIGKFKFGESALADYRVAGYISILATFFIISIMIFVTPYFARNMENKTWIYKNYMKLQKINFIAMLGLHSALYVATPIIIPFLFGPQYQSAIPYMQALTIATFFQTTLRIIPGNILAVIGEEKFNLALNLVAIMIHVPLMMFFIEQFQVMGIVVATGTIYVITGLISHFYLVYRCKNKKGATNE